MTPRSAKRVAILGVGMIGGVHRRAAILAGARIVGVMASSPERSRQVAESWGAEQAYENIDQVADSDVEAVHICTPNASHVPYAIRLMAAGKHVLCEKPLGISLDDAQQAAAAAEAAGRGQHHPVRLPVPPDGAGDARPRAERGVRRDQPHPRQLPAGLVAEPPLHQLAGQCQEGGPSRAFGDIGSHWCDLVEWVTDDKIAELVATTSITIKQRPASTAATMSAVESDAPLIDVDTEDSALILFRTANDIAGSAVITQLSAGRKNRLWVEIDGMQRSAVFDQELPEQLLIGADAGTRSWSAIPTTARRNSGGCHCCRPVTFRATRSASRTT